MRRRTAMVAAATAAVTRTPPSRAVLRSNWSTICTVTRGSAPPVLAPAPRVPPFPDLSSSFLPPLSPGLFGLVGLVGFVVGEAVEDGLLVGDVVGVAVGESVGDGLPVGD